MNYSFLPNGDTGLTVSFKNEISREVNSHVTSFVSEVEKAKIRDVIELVPAFSSVTIIYDPCSISYMILKLKLKRILKNLSQGNTFVPVLYKIPVCYDGEFAPDMANVSKHTGLTKEEIVSIHTSCDYLIYMLGFLPGFAYLGGMDERLVTPRLESPRLEIKKGSVGIGGEQTGIYPVASPGGWQIIGKTPVDVYDRNKESPILYRAGDYIRFVPVSADRYYEIEEMIKNNSYSVESEEVVK